MEIEIVNASNLKSYGKYRFMFNSSVCTLRKIIHFDLKGPAPNRQILRLSRNGPALKDTETFESLELKDGDTIYVKDKGPQIDWGTVFLAEYSGPLFIYLIYYLYSVHHNPLMSLASHMAALCITFHYLKRIYETIYVHRFSHSTMPLWNLFKNCTYYWAFTAYIAWYMNSPLYEPPAQSRLWTGLILFLLSEYGNYSIHMTLRNLRAPGTKDRKIPKPNGNVFTKLFNLVSCPNYTYEILAWVAFGIMTSCYPALIFASVGAYQMALWALAKHRRYHIEFESYPRNRRAIFPYML